MNVPVGVSCYLYLLGKFIHSLDISLGRFSLKPEIADIGRELENILEGRTNRL